MINRFTMENYWRQQENHNCLLLSYRINRCLAPQTARPLHGAPDRVQPALGEVNEEDGLPYFGVESGNFLA